MEQHTHESFAREAEVKIGSERSFGFVMAAVFAVLGTVNWWHTGHVWPWFYGAAGAFAVAAGLWPSILKPLNGAWYRFGLLLHHVVNPVIMGLLFYGAVLPTGLIMRTMGKDFLRLKYEPAQDSYWIVRQPPGPKPETMKDQF
jgi:hypothetical protein